jgi:5'-methylthioadenosine phosphorylase
MVEHADIGIVGGSGLSGMEGLEDVERVEVETPFGKPSDALSIGTMEGIRVAFVPRHGHGHRLLPSEVPSRANIFALKLLGVRQLISVSAVGSLRESIRPLDMVVPTQVVDRTTARPSTFFGAGIVAHISMAEPFCPHLRDALKQASTSVAPRTHDGATYVCIEGPAFSTYAESVLYRQLGFDIIGMTALPEAKLAREASMCYAVLAQVTDYDCWHPEHGTVTSDMVMATVARNLDTTSTILHRSLPLLHPESDCQCHHALEGAIATNPEAIDPEIRRRLAPILAGLLGRSDEGAN